MSLLLPIRPNHVRFLLYTEWVILACCGSLAVLEHRSIPVQHVLILVLLGLMGLRLPSVHAWVKVLYTAIAIILIFSGTVLGYLTF